MKQAQEMFVKWMVFILIQKLHVSNIFYVPPSTDQHMASILLEKFIVRIWLLGNETETKLQFLHFRKCDCFWGGGGSV